MFIRNFCILQEKLFLRVCAAKLCKSRVKEKIAERPGSVFQHSMKTENTVLMTNKQRAYLSKLAVNEKPVLELGKANLTPEFTAALAEALAARELVKISLLKTCVEDPKEAAAVLADRTRSEVVRVIGRKIIFYKAAKKPKIELPQ